MKLTSPILKSAFARVFEIGRGSKQVSRGLFRKRWKMASGHTTNLSQARCSTRCIQHGNPGVPQCSTFTRLSNDLAARLFPGGALHFKEPLTRSCAVQTSILLNQLDAVLYSTQIRTYVRLPAIGGYKLILSIPWRNVLKTNVAMVVAVVKIQHRTALLKSNDMSQMI